ACQRPRCRRVSEGRPAGRAGQPARRRRGARPRPDARRGTGAPVRGTRLARPGGRPADQRHPRARDPPAAAAHIVPCRGRHPDRDTLSPGQAFPGRSLKTHTTTMTPPTNSTAPLRHFLQFRDLSAEEIQYVLARARIIKDKFKRYEPHMTLHDRTLAMVFEKASTRTRVSFEAGMYQMGGSVIHLTTNDSQLGRSEPIEDTARVISRMVDLVMIRTFEQTRIERFAAHSRVPVINGLTNEFHPCQILADIFTFIEHQGPIQGKTVAWIGDANNMAYTWLQAAEILGFTLHVSAPKGYQLEAARIGQPSAQVLRQFDDPIEACRGAHLVTTDVWTSMGYEDENEARRKAFAHWCVDAEMMAVADPAALFMHCLPAHRGEEVSADVIDGPQSVVWDEAENRMHVQKALMEFLLLGHL